MAINALTPISIDGSPVAFEPRTPVGFFLLS
jgi:hypothetical protein